MAISPELRKILQQALKIRNSQVPMHRVMDILATEEGDMSTVIHRFRDIRNEDLRRALHFCAELLRSLEQEAGMKPGWETYQAPGTAPALPGAAGPGSGAGQAGGTAPALSRQTAPASPPTPPKPKFRPEDLQSFEDAEAIGQVPLAKMFVDGASKGNPGESGIGVALMTMEGKRIAQIGRGIGTATNNIAEYTALIEGLKLAERMGVKKLFVLSDSQLMVRQMNGQYKIKNVDILHKVKEAKSIAKAFEKLSLNYIERENNTLADALSTCALKKKKEAAAPAGEIDFSEDLMGHLPEDTDEGATD